MSTFRISPPGGGTFMVTAPDGATEAQVLEVVRQQFFAPKGRKPDALDDPNMATSGMSGTEKFLSGAGKAGYDLVRGVGQITGLASQEDIDGAKKRDAALMQTGAGMAGNMVGNIAAMAPTAIIPGVNTVAGGAALGAITGALQPVASDESRLGNTLENAALGGGVNAAVRLAPSVVKSLVDPFTQGGRQGLVGDVLQRFGAGGQSIPAKTPGWKPTLAESTQSPGAAILERGASSTDPTIARALTERGMENNGAAIQALRQLAGTPEDQKLAVAARDYMAGPLYKQATEQGIDQGMAAAMKPQIKNLMDRPSMKLAASVAKQTFGEESITLAKQGDLKGLQYMKQALDDIIEKASSPTSSIGKNQLAALQQTRSDLVSTLQDIAPKLREADTQYAVFSRPINESKVAGAMEEKLVPALMAGADQPHRMTANNFATSLRNLDDQIPKMTGYPGSTVENTMSPGGMTALQGIKSDLMRRAAAQEMARGAGSNTAQNLASQNIIRQTLGPLGLPESVAGSIAKSTFGRSLTNNTLVDFALKIPDKAIQEEIAKALLNPQYAAELIKKANTPLLTGKTKMAAQLLQLMAAPTALGVANSQKQ